MFYYLFAIIDGIKGTLTFFTCISGLLVIVFGIGCFIQFSTVCNYPNNESEKKTLENLKKPLKLASIVCLILAFFTTIIPTQKQLAFIIAAPYIIENQQLQEAGKNSAEIIKLGTEYLKNIVNKELEKNNE